MSRIGAWTLLARNQQIGGKIGLFSDAEQAVPMVHDFSSALISTRGYESRREIVDHGYSLLRIRKQPNFSPNLLISCQERPGAYTRHPRENALNATRPYPMPCAVNPAARSRHPAL